MSLQLLLDVRLSGNDGLDWLADIRALGVLGRVIVVSGHLDDSIVRRARALGVHAVLAKPVSMDELLQAVQLALRARQPLGDAWARGWEGTPAERWVTLLLQTIENPHDPHIRDELSRRGAVSLTTLKRICRRVKVQAHDTRDLARMLCLLVWSRRLAVPVEVLAQASDSTLKRLTERSGIADRLETARVRDLLDQQRFVPQDNFAFRLLRRALLGEPLSVWATYLSSAAMGAI